MISRQEQLKMRVLETDDFSRDYPLLNNHLLQQPEVDSRNGKTWELLNFKTELTNPYKRCVGGYGRNINIYFLLAEALWIFAGRKDVKFLEIFNARMRDFSDDGETFHAPYGFRLRHWGVRSEDKFTSENMHAAQGADQVADAIRIFAENPATRQVVMSIWNPDFDLGAQSKDIPCNDMVKMKIRNGELHTTIQNRSNDLHWGLPTNIFQFSFLTEIMAMCLGVRLGTQVHNSQSLHVYEWSDVAFKMRDEYGPDNGTKPFDEARSLYVFCKAKEIDFNFTHEVPNNRLVEINGWVNMILSNVEKTYETGFYNVNEMRALSEVSQYLFEVFSLLHIYVKYKRGDWSKEDVINIFNNWDSNQTYYGRDWDMSVLARNFFHKRLGTTEENNPLIGTL